MKKKKYEIKQNAGKKILVQHSGAPDKLCLAVSAIVTTKQKKYPCMSCFYFLNVY